MEVIVLAGGMGTRLRQVVSDVPKPMAPVKDAPFLKYILDWVVKHAVSKIILSVGYKAEIIEEYFGASYQGIPITYAVEDKPLGTGGGIKLAMNNVRHEAAVVVNGDTYFPVNLDNLYQEHLQYGGDVTVALKSMIEFDRYGTVRLVNNVVTDFVEKTYCAEGIINGGIYVVNKSVVEGLPEIFSFETEVLEKLAASGLVNGILADAPFLDIGIPEDYVKAESYL